MSAVRGAIGLVIGAIATIILLPWNPEELSAWGSGTGIVLGAAVVLAILSRRVPSLWSTAPVGFTRDAVAQHPSRSMLVVVLASFAAYAGVAQLVFEARPLNLDEIAQLFQARIFAEGRLWLPAPAHPDFFSIYHIVDVGGRVYGQFPAGGPAMLALGELLGAAWIVGPVCGAVAVAAWWLTLREIEPAEGTRIGAVLLFAFAPFFAFHAGTAMNHVPATMWLLVALAMLARVVNSDAPRPLAALASGMAFGMAATIRPADALAFALPAGIWLVARTITRPSRWRELGASGVGVAMPLALLLWVNAATTGAPLRFGYEVLWGKAHGIGFHIDPSGTMHTVERGLALVLGYLRSLQTHLFEAPVPALLPAFCALALAPRLRAFDRYLLACSAALLGIYVAYWFDGEYLGPRFLLPLVPVLALWTARLPAFVKKRMGDGIALRITAYAYVVAALIAIGALIPTRARIYASAAPGMRFDVDAVAAAAGVRDAVVLVRESWGSQLLARLHAMGISRADASWIYRRSDSCLLDERVRELERAGLRGDDARARLLPLLADSARLIRSPFSPHTAERVLPGATYGEHCLTRIRDDREGFTTLTPLVLGRANVYARDLHERNALLLAEYPDRPVYLLRPVSEAPGARLVFTPVSRDSITALGAR